MKVLIVVLAVTATILVMSGCSGNDQNEPSSSRQASEAAGISSSAAVYNQKDSVRKFIRSSAIKFRVKDVAKATDQIEDLTRSFNGFVTYTHLESITESKKMARVSLDSSLEIIQYSVANNMVIRVPNVKLDSALKAIGNLIDYLEYRTIKADDVALQIRSNQKTQARASGNGQRVRTAIDHRGKRLKETAYAENLATDRQKEADDAEIANLDLTDQVSYSTIKLSLYQRSESKQWIVANDPGERYRTGIGLRLWESLKTGWYLAEDIFVFFTRLWLPILLGIIVFFIYKKYKLKKQLLHKA